MSRNGDAPGLAVGVPPALVEALDRLADRDPPRYLSAKRAAEHFDVSEDWMRRHAERFGAVRLDPDNPRSPLRFPIERLHLDGDDPPPAAEPEPPRAPRRRRRVPSRADLLPVGDDT